MAQIREAKATGARNMTNNNQEWYSVAELAKVFGVGKQTVRNWINAGELDCIRFGVIARIPKAAVEKFIAAAKSTAKESSQPVA